MTHAIAIHRTKLSSLAGMFTSFVLNIVHIVHILYVMLLARSMSLGQEKGLVGLTKFDLNFPLETNAHSDRVAVFRAAAHYALTSDEVEEILDVAEPLISYLKRLTITSMLMWKLEIFYS
jgi:hypothetical protein